MAIGVNKRESLVALVEEVTQGTIVQPTLGTQFLQVLEGLSSEPSKEVVERAILLPNKGQIKPRTSLKSGTFELPTEWKGSGTEGDAPETDLAWKALLGGRRQITSRITTGAGHTTTVIQATAHGLSKGDFIVILEAGDHTMHFVKDATNANDFTITPARDVAPSDAVEIAESTTYFASTNEPTLSGHLFWGDEIQESYTGSRAASMSLENATTGQIPQATFAFQSLSFTEVDASAPVSPTYDDEVPPLALSVKLFQNDVCLDMNEFSLSVENTISDLSSVKEASGKISSLITDRAVSGSLTPYMDDSNIDLFTQFEADSDFEITVTLGNPSAVAGELDLGSCVGFYCPQASFTALGKGDLDDIMTRPAEFTAHSGATGTETELFLGFC